jgi:hypothetical protein
VRESSPRPGLGAAGSCWAEASDKQLEQYDPFAPMNAHFDELCPAYLQATPEERAEIRGVVSDKPGVLSGLLGYVMRAASRLRSTSEAEWLRRGLAAASIENCCRDYRDALLAWAELYVAAQAVGLDPRPAFREVAKLSSREKPAGGTTPVSRMLSGFHRYGALKERQRKEADA